MSRSDFLREDSKETLVSLAEFKGAALRWRRSGERQSRTAFRPFAAGKNAKKPVGFVGGDCKGAALLWQRKDDAGARDRGKDHTRHFGGSLRGRIQRNRTVSWRGIQRGRRPRGTRLCLQGLVCYTFCGRGRGKGAAAMGSPQNEVLWGEEEQRSE